MQPKRKLTIEDYCSIRQVSSPQISPDGSRILFSVKDPLASENRYVTHIYLSDQDGGYRQLTNKGSDNNSPVWSPTGSVAFLSDMGGTQALWTCSPSEEGPLIKLASVGENPSSPRWSPDSKRLLFLSRVPEGEPQASDVLVIRTLPYKFDNYGFLKNKWSHIFVADEQNGEPAQITDGEFSVTAAAWDKSGNKIAYLAGKGERREFSYWNDVWMVDLKNQEHVKMTNGERYFQSLSFSPDGKLLAYIGRKRNYGLATKTDVYVLDLKTKNESNLTAEFNSKIGDTVSGGTSIALDPSPVWTNDSRSIYFLTALNDVEDLYVVSLEGKEVQRVTDATKSIQSYSFSEDQTKMVFLASSNSSVSEIWLRENGKAHKVTGFNDGLMKEIHLSIPDKFTFTASDNVNVTGYFYKPIGADPQAKAPMILILKGGPHTWCYGNAFNFQAQILAANGYAVLLTNERGSGGYGEEFARTARAKLYGERDFQDVMEAIEYVLRNFSADGARLGITGYSRGGYLTNWAVTHTDMFKAAVSAGGISNFYSFSGIGDEMYVWCEENFDAQPWDNEELYLSKSPIRYVRHVTTPTLIMHGQQDFRSSVTQAEEFYTSLKRMGKDSELVIFPGENHGLPRTSSPRHLMEYHRHVLRWFDKYLGVKQICQK